MVLEAVGYDPEKYGGFAAGFGVERFAMIMHNIQVQIVICMYVFMYVCMYVDFCLLVAYIVVKRKGE